MAPPKKRSKGLTRMDAALDAMRPMGFKDSSVRKCVKDLLKVYGGSDYWKFIEESSYKVLIDTMLDIPEEPPCLEHVPEPPLEGNVDDSHKLLVSESESCKEVIVGVEEATALNCSSVQALLEEIDAIEEEEQGQLEAVVPPKLLEDDVSIGFAPTGTPQTRDIAPRNQEPCYGWISDDE